MSDEEEEEDSQYEISTRAADFVDSSSSSSDSDNEQHQDLQCEQERREKVEPLEMKTEKAAKKLEATRKTEEESSRILHVGEKEQLLQQEEKRTRSVFAKPPTRKTKKKYY